MNYKIEAMQPSDWGKVKDIYLEGIKTKLATFQTEAPSWEYWDKTHVASCRLVARCGNDLLGWTALTPASIRACYAVVAEISIYISGKAKGQGVGTALLTNLIKQSEEHGFWTLFSSVLKKNTASLALHKKCGFREVGTREKLARMSDGIWHDVILMERRSTTVGID